MTLKSHAKFEEKLACGLENDEEFAKFSSEHLAVLIFVFSWDLLSKAENTWAPTYRGAISNDTEEWWKIWRGIDL